MSGKQREWSRIEVKGRVCEVECMGYSPRDGPLTFMRCHRYMKSLKGGNPSVAEPTT